MNYSSIITFLNSFLKRHVVVYAIFLIAWIAIVATNFVPGTWLIGWDNLHPEFNFELNISRTTQAVWREYQGLGLLAGIAHASDISRQLILGLFSWFLPSSLLRYSWTLGMLLLGPIGTYHLLKYLIKKETFLLTRESQQASQSHQYTVQKIAAFTGAFFYLFNIATVQYFFVPLESFSTFYGFLPWLFLTTFSFLANPTKKKTLLYAGLSFLATSAFHVQTMFIVFMVALAFIYFGYLIKSKILGFFTVLQHMIITIIVHSFWLLPIVYFTLTNADATVLSKQNAIATPETQHQNMYAGSLPRILQLKGYWFELTDINESTLETEYLFNPWREHFESPITTTFAYVLFSIASIGLVWALFLSFSKTKTNFFASIGGIFIFSLIMLSNGNGLIGTVFDFLVNTVPLFGQIFRVAFTKWSMVTALCMSVGIASATYYSSHYLARYLSHFSKKNFIHNLFRASDRYASGTRFKRTSQHKIKIIFAVLIALFIGSLHVFITYPVLQGHLFYEKVRLEIPTAYFELFEELATIPNQAKIVHLPLHSLWGWQHNTWGYRGSGFLWYGIRQSIIDRNFDVWSHTNEQIYQQLNRAMITGNNKQFTDIITLYNINYALLDESIISLNSKTNNTKKTKEMLSAVQAELIWQSDFLKLYKFSQDTHTKNTISTSLPIPTQLKNSQEIEEKRTTAVPIFTHLPRTSQFNPYFETYGNYFYPYLQNNQDLSRSLATFPFSHLLGSTTSFINNNENGTVTIYPDLENIDLKSPLQVRIPGFQQDQPYITNATVTIANNTLRIMFEPAYSIFINDTILPLPQLPATHFDLKNTFSTNTNPNTNVGIGNDINDSNFVLQINEQVLEISANQSKQFSLHSLKVGQPIEILIADLDKVDIENGNYFVDKSDIAEFIIPTLAWNMLYQPKVKTIEELESIKIDISSPQIKLNLQDWGDVVNCDVLQRGSVTKELLPNSALYTAENFGTACIGFDLNTLSSQHDYILKTDITNISGKKPKVYIENMAKKEIVLHELLNESTQTSLIHGVPDSVDLGYYLTFENKSFGDLTSNEFKTTELYLLDIDLLSNIQIREIKTSEKDLSLPVIAISDKLAPYAYKWTGTINEKSLLKLDTSYNSGWIAFNPSNIFSLQKFPHTNYNSWANAWIIPPGEHTIIIFYWPQLLSFAGYGLLIGLGGWFGWIGIANRLKQNPF